MENSLTDDRTQAWQQNHDMTDPRNQLPTEAERQEFSRERLSKELAAYKEASNREVMRKVKNDFVRDATITAMAIYIIYFVVTKLIGG